MKPGEVRAWTVTLAAFGGLFVVSIVTTGEATHNGPWLLMVSGFVGFVGRMVTIAIAGGGDD